MFKKVLIANRGEIARRLISVAQRMGMKAVAVYSDADAQLPFVKEPTRRAPGRLRAQGQLPQHPGAPGGGEGHRGRGHTPGYGFVSESAEFARAVTAQGLVFVGPPPEAMARMKDKSEARRLVQEAGVPTIPGSPVLADVAAALAAAEQVGYPVLLKAAGGGGGIGMQVANSAAELEKAFRACTDRARSAFGREAVYLERYFPTPRHLEVQILGDTQGTTLHVLERECSIQRRHQKVVEEAGSPLFLDDKNAAVRAKLFDAALKAAKAFGYANAGTVECLYSDGEVYFIEMNARLQVEHPVTELTTGVDLIGWQFRIAAGEKLNLTQAQVARCGHALEFRVYAEDPVKFFPSPGPLKVFRPPTGEGVRLDSGYAEGDVVTPFYDPMIAKLIISGKDRAEATARAITALEGFTIEGIKHNLPLHLRILKSPAFVAGELDTRFLEKHARP